MKSVLLAAAVLAVAAPAVAADLPFTGARAEITAGYNDVHNYKDTNDVNYGAAVGFDVPIGQLRAGVEGTADNVFQSTRQYGVGARLGYVLSPRFMVYGKAGYEDYRSFTNHDFDGVRYGGGVEYAITSHSFLKAEYRRSNYTQGVAENGAIAGFGIRF